MFVTLCTAVIVIIVKVFIVDSDITTMNTTRRELLIKSYWDNLKTRGQMTQ